MRILIINIDYDYRSIYTGMIASCLLKKIPMLEITAFVSTDNQLLTTTGLFKDIHFFDTAEFFQRTKSIGGAEVSEEMRKALTPVIDTRWDVVINLSSNLLGSMFPSFLNYGEIKGSFVDGTMSGIKHSDSHSYFLTGMPDDVNTYFHFTYLYRSILRRFEEVTLNSVWDENDSRELNEHFRLLREKHGRSNIVFIDYGLRHQIKETEEDFYAELYAKLYEQNNILPILLTKHELTADHPIVKHMRKRMNADVHSFTCATQAQLSVINHGQLLITTNLYAKAMADIGLKPSVLVSNKLNLSDYSVIDGSLQVVTPQRDVNAVELISSLCQRIFKGEEITPRRARDGIEIYRTKVNESLPVIAPLFSNGNIKYASWWLRLKFLGRVLNVELPQINLDPVTYRTAILQERGMNEQEVLDGISFFAQELAKADIKTGPLIDHRNVQARLNQFFDGEEASL